MSEKKIKVYSKGTENPLIQDIRQKELQPKLLFIDFITSIKQEYVLALKLYCNIKTGKEEKTKEEWQQLFNNMLNRRSK